MGKSCVSVHFKTDDAKAIAAAAKKAVKEAGGSMFIAPAAAGWVSVYPSKEFFDSGAIDAFVELAGVERAVAFQLYDSDVLMYWLYRGGACVDYYNSAPDYFGAAEEGDMDAAGDVLAFEGLLDVAGRKRLATVLRPRMVDGEHVGGRGPDREEDRLVDVGKLLGIAGVLGLFEDIEDGKPAAGVAKTGLVRVG